MAENTAYFISKQLHSVIKHLCQSSSLSVGYIHGFTLASEHYLVSCSTLADGEKPGLLYDAVTQSLPGGINITGLYLIADKVSDTSVVENKCRNEIAGLFKMLPEESPSLLLTFDLCKSVDDFRLYEYDEEYSKLTPLPCSVTDADILSNCMLARLQANLPVIMEHTDNKEKLRNDLFAEIENWKEELMCQNIAFHVKDSDILLLTGVEGQKTDYTYSDILEHIQKDDADDDGFSWKIKKKTTSYSNKVIHLRLLCQRTDGESSQSTMTCAPIIHHKHGPFTHMEINLPIDIVAYVHPDMSAAYLADNLLICICNQLTAFHSVITSGKESAFHTAVPYHFKPTRLNHLITVVYPENKSDEQLESTRRHYHAIYNLPKDIPQIRKLNAFMFPDEQLPGGCLINPHVGLQGSGVSGGHLSVVRGSYAYHHYMQDHMDDNGWGCAYRSLQTLVSWFRLQGYTDKPVPSHRDIQQVLVDIGDKESKFLGSKQWIGSTEVSYVLDHLLGVSSKILFVSSGAELENKARELAVHFDTQGTPVMIGGGVLAHTILGVDFNERTGAVKFLILDPHYTGGEDLKTIQDKGWCGWKGPNFWDKNAYYNLCMPQRPLVI